MKVSPLECFIIRIIIMVHLYYQSLGQNPERNRVVFNILANCITTHLCENIVLLYQKLPYIDLAIYSQLLYIVSTVILMENNHVTMTT